MEESTRMETAPTLVERQQHRSSCWWCWTFLGYTFQTCQTILVLVLTVVVLSLVHQVHRLDNEIAAEDNEFAMEDQEILDLIKQIQSQKDVQEDLNERVEQEHSLTLYQMAGTFTLLSCLLTAFHMTQHLSNFHEAVVQRKILAILWMSPIYGITSFLGLIFPSSDGYLSVLKDFYEAYVVYTFLSFLIAVLGRGDREAAVRVLALHADHFKPPTRCLANCYHPDPNTSKEAMASAVLMECQILAMQFVLVRPITSILRFLCESLLVVGPDAEEDPYHYFKSPLFYISMVTNISVFLAFNGLLKFYHAVQEDLQWCKPFSKFMSIKGIVFLTFWQGLLISILFNLNFSPAAAVVEMTPTLSPTVMVTSAPVTPMLHLLTPSPAIVPVATASPVMIPKTPSPSPIEGATIDLLDGGTRRFLNQDDNDTGNEDSNDDDNRATPDQVQNFLICLEMLFFSIAHWCVFPAEEWAPDYRPKQHYAKPGIGLKDFASDISYIVSSTSSARRYRRGDSSVESSERSGCETELTVMEHEML